MKIYIDSEFKCHTVNDDGSFREFDVSFFDSKCVAFIEGYRYVPFGERWTRSDSVVFHGEMIVPWKDFDKLDNAQREYERQKMNEYKESLLELGVEL